MEDKKKQYNQLLVRFLKGMQYLENASIPYETRLRSLNTWLGIRSEMDMLLKDIGEMPENKIGGTLVPFIIGGVNNNDNEK